MKFLYFLFLLPFSLYAIEAIPEAQWTFVERYCIDCHDEDMNEGNINLDFEKVDWQNADIRKHWGIAHKMLKNNKMPPKRKKKQPTAEEKKSFLTWLDHKLIEVEPIGGTTIRRLNKREYLSTVREFFGMKNFNLPGSFPQDKSAHGFDTLAKDLVVSPSHFEAYKETAIAVADYLFPPEKEGIKKTSWHIKPEDLTISYSSAYLIDGAMRLASKGTKTKNGTWPSKFEAPASGTYKVKVVLSSKNPPAGHKPIVEMKSHRTVRDSNERELASMTVQKGEAQEFIHTVDLYKGENLLFLYKNSLYNYGEKNHFEKFLVNLFTKEPRLAAAWANPKDIARGGNGWARVKEKMKSGKLNVAKFKKKQEIQKLANYIAHKRGGNAGETLVYKFFEEGANIGIHGIEVTGPLKLITDSSMKIQVQTQKEFFNGREKKDLSHLNETMGAYLKKAFRREVTEEEIDKYVSIVKTESANTGRIDDGYHLAIRTSLISPEFLYREFGEGKLSQVELASRLSYFLTSSAPDEKLMVEAAKGTLFRSEVLRKQTARLLKSFKSTKFIHDFTSQWLDTGLLDSIMPDTKVFRRFNQSHANMMKDEVETHFKNILTKNMSLKEFIDPNFIYTNNLIGKEIYKLKKAPKSKSLSKVSISRGTTKGGLLSMPAVMMATANGVDTEPVLRGVWILENILGSHLPAPPQNVPALPPDTTGAKDPRDKLAKHMGNASCASCHEDIDPMGFVLESFDPVGRWRTHYPSAKRNKTGLKINTAATMADGTELKDVRDLKKYLVENPEHFANCLASKLLEYATGRHLNYREKKMKEEIVARNIKNGNKFHDLMLELIDSPIFKAR